MKCARETLLLYAVTDRAWLNGGTLYQQVESALKGGVTCVQLREKQLSYDEFLEEALQIGALCRKYGVPFIVNDDVDIAVKCGADGVHVGQSDMLASGVRKAIGENMLLGVSAQTVQQALLAEKSGADYLGVGAVFHTDTKPDADDVSYETLKAICAAVSIPVVAIGGINKTNLPTLSGSGVAGAALVSAIFAAQDIQSECRQLKALAQETVK